jgi:hypothetical protein
MVAVKLQLAVVAAMFSPAKATVLLVKLVLPPVQPAPATALTAVTVKPAGKVSVKPRLVCAGLPAPLLTVKVKVADPPTPTGVVAP